MLRDRFFLTLFIVLILIAAVDIIANAHFLFFKFWWLDLVIHFFGGIWVGGMALWLYSRFCLARIGAPSVAQAFLFSTLSAFTIGVLWEIFQLLTEIYLLPKENYFLDTTTDLTADVLGGGIAVILFLYMRKNLRTNTKTYEHVQKEG